MDGGLKLIAGRSVTFTVPGLPKAKERPRTRVVTPRGKKPFATIYTPKSTKGFEASVEKYAAIAMGKDQVFAGPVRVTLIICLPIAKSLPKYRQKAIRDGLEACTKKPDEDNVAKAVKDAMNGVVYKDDSQIVRSTVIKDFSDEPRVSVRVTELVVPATLNQTDKEMAPALLSPKPCRDKGLVKQGEDGAVALKSDAVAPAFDIGKSSQSRIETTACGATSITSCPNHSKKGAPWCITCLPPGLHDRKNRPQNLVVIGETEDA